MKQNFLILITAAICLAAACQRSKKTKQGLIYTIYTNGKGEQLRNGNVIKVSLIVTLGKKDSVLMNNTRHLPNYIKIDTSIKNSFSFLDILSDCRVGDSVITKTAIDSFVARKIIAYNELYKKGDFIVSQIKILKLFKTDEEAQADYLQEVNKETNRENALIESYLTKEKIDIKKDSSGIYLQIKQQGTGPFADSGKVVSVRYTGRLLSNGKIFDSNADTTLSKRDPFSFTVKAGMVIPGWDAVMPKLKKGAIATFYVPALMAYGQSNQPSIPAYSNLIFDVQIVDVKTAPKADNKLINGPNPASKTAPNNKHSVK